MNNKANVIARVDLVRRLDIKHIIYPRDAEPTTVLAVESEPEARAPSPRLWWRPPALLAPSSSPESSPLPHHRPSVWLVACRMKPRARQERFPFSGIGGRHRFDTAKQSPPSNMVSLQPLDRIGKVMPIRSGLVLAAVALAACAVSPPTVGDEFEVAPGLEMTVWASDPLLVNPTNFDIDERGRVWFIESVNYRSDLKSQPKNDLMGDRIVILEDTDGDGQADSRKVFDQHAEMLAPLGISVLGSKVVVSQSPDLFVYTKDEDDRIISKETLLTGWGGVDHDHGLHVVLFGHDGRYYFNSGDQGFETTDRSGNTFRSSREGPFFAATVQSMNPDGTDFRVLAHNARNPYEIALDSFGSIWQTDNDDDGNQWTRLLYVMEGANFGYWGPGGRRWREDKGTHFHEERPSTVPYVARTGPRIAHGAGGVRR